MARWVRTSVELLSHHVLDVGAYDRRSAWQWLIMHAAWKDKKVNHKGRSIELKRGQVLVGRAFLADTWGWSEQNVRTFIHLLVREGMAEINQSNGHLANVLTICNYDKYQSCDDDEQPAHQPEHNQSLTSAQPEPNQTSTSNTTTTNLEENNSELARATVPKVEAIAITHDELQSGLEAAGGRALANTAAAPGLLNLSVPYGWLRHGADLKTVVLPAIRARAASRPAGTIRSWDYFSTAVAEAKAKQDAGLPIVTISNQPMHRPAPGSYRTADIERAKGMQAKLKLNQKSESVTNA